MAFYPQVRWTNLVNTFLLGLAVLALPGLTRAAVSESIDPLSPHSIWHANLPAAPVAPLVAGTPEKDYNREYEYYNQRYYITHGKGIVAFDANTGKKLWDHRLGDMAGAPVPITESYGDEESLYATTEDGRLFKLLGRNGTAMVSRWVKRQSCSQDRLLASPTIQRYSDSNDAFQKKFKEDLVFVITYAGCGDDSQNRVHAFYASTLKPAWTFNAGLEYGLGFGASSCALDIKSNLLFCGTNLRPGTYQNTIWAIDTLTGELAWAVNAGSIHSAPLLNNGTLYVATYNGEIKTFEPGTGNAIWSVTITKNANLIKSPVLTRVPNVSDNPIILQLDTGGYLHRVDDQGKQAEKIWTSRVDSQSPPVVVPELEIMYLGSGQSGHIKTYELRAGNKSYQEGYLTDPKKSITEFSAVTSALPHLSNRLVALTNAKVEVYGPSFDAVPLVERRLQLTASRPAETTFSFTVENRGSLSAANIPFTIYYTDLKGRSGTATGTVANLAAYAKADAQAVLALPLEELNKLTVRINDEGGLPEGNQDNNAVQYGLQRDLLVDHLSVVSAGQNKSALRFTLHNLGNVPTAANWKAVVTARGGQTFTFNSDEAALVPAEQTIGTDGAEVAAAAKDITSVVVTADPANLVPETNERNNERKTVSTYDLAIKKLQVEKNARGLAEALIQISNSGSGLAVVPLVITSFDSEGRTTTNRAEVRALAGKTTPPLHLALNQRFASLAQVTVVADPEDLVGETNEKNNSRTLTIRKIILPKIILPPPLPATTTISLPPVALPPTSTPAVSLPPVKPPTGCESFTAKDACVAALQCGWKVALGAREDTGQCVNNLPPNKPVLESPANGSTVTELTPKLAWKDLGDPDNTNYLGKDNFRMYRWYLTDVDINQKIWDRDYSSQEGGTDPLCQDSIRKIWYCLYATVPAGKLQYGKRYRWSVEASDGINGSGYASSTEFKVDYSYVPTRFFGASPAQTGGGGGGGCQNCEFFGF